MFRAFVVVVLLAGSVAAQSEPAPLKFRWETGQKLTYTLRQVTSVSETTLDDKSSVPATAMTVTKLALTRRWDVKSVDANGNATLEMSITAMRQDIARPGPADKDGKPTVDRFVIDSTTPEGTQQTAEYLNKPILTIKLSPTGQLLEVKSQGGSENHLQAALPFRVQFPETAPQIGTPWNRPFSIKLDPPYGTGEQYEASQTYTLAKHADGLATVNLKTALKAPPSDAALLPALVPLLWEGAVTFDTKAGRYSGAKLSIERDVPNHQGAGSKFSFRTDYTETIEP